ncbi:DNA-binding transcriptional regulator [Pirellulales bacterium]|nr:DNA-binding transcriptional regulator [Pirellulales bacterium]
MEPKIPHVALLIETSRSYGRGLLRGVRRYSTEHGPWSVYMDLRALDSKPPVWLKNWRGDGILVRTGDKTMADAVMAAKLPTVELRASRLMEGYPFVGVDNHAMGRLVLEQFLERGFRHFGLFGVDTEDYFKERCDNFVVAVNEAGFQCDVYRQRGRHEKPADWERQQEHVSKWVSSLPKPIGVMACTDQLGFWFLDACKRAGVSVPEEVAVVGVENDETLTTMSTPPMSSVRFNGEKAGYEAAAILARLMAGEPLACEQLLIPPLGIAVRQSSDIVAVEDAEIAQALRFIRENASRGISVDDVLRAIPMSRAGLDQQMRKAIGRTAKAEIGRLQLEHVKRLLAETDLSLAQIAERSGFRHPQYMAELFKKKCGKTPGSFRAEHQGL